MKRLLFLLTCLYLIPAFATVEYTLIPRVTGVIHEGNLFSSIYQKYTGHCSEMLFEKFQIYEKHDSRYTPIKIVTKPKEWTRTYELYDWTQTHIYTKRLLLSKHCAYFDSGSIFDCMKQFDIQDSSGNTIGYIQGSFFADDAAEFTFYKEDHSVFAMAYLDNSWSNLNVLNMDGDAVYSCHKQFHFNYEGRDLVSLLSSKKPASFPDEYRWNVTYDDKHEFDSRFFWPFICFISEVWWPGTTE